MPARGKSGTGRTIFAIRKYREASAELAPGERPRNEIVKSGQLAPRFESVTEWNGPVSECVCRGYVSPKCDTDDDTNAGPSASYRPHEVGFVFWRHGTRWSVLD